MLLTVLQLYRSVPVSIFDTWIKCDAYAYRAVASTYVVGLQTGKIEPDVHSSPSTFLDQDQPVFVVFTSVT